MKPEQLKRLAEAQGKRAEICRGPDSELLGVYLLDDEGRVTERYQPDVDKAQAMDLLKWVIGRSFKISFFDCSDHTMIQVGYHAYGGDTLPEAIVNAALSMLESE